MAEKKGMTITKLQTEGKKTDRILIAFKNRFRQIIKKIQSLKCLSTLNLKDIVLHKIK